VQWFLLLLYQTVRAGSDELQNCHLSCIAAASADLDDAGVAAVAVSVLGADLVKQLLCNIFLGDVGVDLTLGVQVAGLAKLIIFSAMERTSLARVTVVSILPFSNR